MVTEPGLITLSIRYIAVSSIAMSRRTYESDGHLVVEPQDLDELVKDKREGWRASQAKARRRQRRYKKRLLTELARDSLFQEDG